MTQHPGSGGCTHSDSAPEGVNPDTGWGGRIPATGALGGHQGWLGERGWTGGSVPFIIGGVGGGSQEGSSTGSSLPWEQWVARMAAVAVVVVAVMVMMVWR